MGLSTTLLIPLILLLTACHARIKYDGPNPKKPGSRRPVPALYNQRYSEQTFIGTHDAAALRTEENGYSLSGNQYYNISTQLNSGIRLLQGQGHADPNGSSDIRICHFNCALMDGGSLQEFLQTVKVFLDANPHEVVTLLFVNTGVPIERWVKAYYETGLDLLSYVPPANKRYGNMRTSDWPIISEMVAAHQRVVTFLSQGADQNQVPFLLPEFNYMFETEFTIDSPDQYSCQPSRPWWVRDFIPDRLSLVNHFLYAQFLGFRYPNATFANITNAAGFHTGELGEHAVRCRQLYDRRPNFLLVDFFSEGEVFDVEYGLNAF
uniref:PLC-like phosphodiesterase n=1 Tax=Ramularia collo-cygni TaxID=112498 RepID=A0A2D3UNT6_9PEZI